MVRILGSGEDNRKTEERANKLELLTRKFFAEGKSYLECDKNAIVWRIDNAFSVLRNPPVLPEMLYMEVNASLNLIMVYNSNYLDCAKQIAESYERENPGEELMIEDKSSGDVYERFIRGQLPDYQRSGVVFDA